MMIRSAVVLVSVLAVVANGQGCEAVDGYSLFADEGANGGTCYDTTFAQCVSACEDSTQCSAFDWRGPQRCCNFMNGPPANRVPMQGLCTYVKSGCEAVAGYSVFPDQGANGGNCYDTTFPQCLNACEATTQCSAFDWRGPKRCCNFMDGPPVNLVTMKGLCTYIKSDGNTDIPLERWYSRSAWGARPPRGCSTRAMSPGNITIHHTAGVAAPNATAGQARCRSIQSFHQNDRGWCDIGYHFLVDLAGNIYQGRPFAATTSWPAPGTTVPPLVIGAHAGGANTNNIGISVMANFGSNAVMQRGDAAYNAVVLLSAHLALGYGISINTVTLRGHRDWSSTSCPGQVYDLMAQFRTDIRALMNSMNSLQQDLPFKEGPWHN